MKKIHFDIQGMTCASCQAHVTKAVEKLDGTENVNVNLLTNDMTVDIDENKVDISKIINAVEDAGYGASVSCNPQEINLQHSNKINKSYSMRNRVQESNDLAIKNMKSRLIISLIFWIPLMIIAMHKMLHISMPIFDGMQNSLIFALTQITLTIPIIIANKDLLKNGIKSLVKLKPNMDALVAIGSIASFIYGYISIFKMAYGFEYQELELIKSSMNNLYFDSAGTILTLITLGKFFEAKSKGKTGDAISKLIKLAPKTSIVIRNGKEETIQTEEILLGDILVIKPGSSIPVDGIIIEGSASINQSSITGESILQEKSIGDEVFSGTINENGYIKMKATKVGDETTLAKIVKLVEEASVSKAPIENIADKIAYYFVPIVIGISIISLLVWLFVGANIADAFNFAISVLVISCPCALGLATPVAIMVGTGKGAEYGILFKTADALQSLGEVKYVVFDKTGTITEGKPKVTDIVTEIEEKEFLKIAYLLEKSSEHPLAKAIIEMENNELIETNNYKITDFKAVPGRGVVSKINGKNYFAGNIQLMKENNIQIEKYNKKANELLNQGKTVLYFADDKEIIGLIAAIDTIKDDSKIAINLLKKLGIKTAIVTGDNRLVASEISKQVGIKEFYADVLPQDKEKIVSNLQSKKNKVAFVGDGINDSPALAKADVGIAIGTGTDIAIDSADVILVKNSLIDVVNSINLSKKTLKNIKENLFWAFFYNVICIPLAAGVYYKSFGLKLNPMIGALAMSMSSLFVVTNALRLKFLKFEKNQNLKQREEKLMKEEIKIEGMMCNNCVNHVKKALEGIDGVEKVEVSLENKNAKIEISKEVSNDTIKNAIEEEGYKVIDIIK